jgi:hypothetical protein
VTIILCMSADGCFRLTLFYRTKGKKMYELFSVSVRAGTAGTPHGPRDGA